MLVKYYYSIHEILVIFLDVRKTILRPNTLTESLKITLGEE
jgi:hypothetical protein